MPSNRKTAKTSGSADITLRMEELTNQFQRQMDDFKGELTRARGTDSEAAGNYTVDDLSIRFDGFQEFINCEIERIKKDIVELRKSVEFNDQLHARNKLIIYGLKVEENESSSSLLEKTIQTLNINLKNKNIVIDKNQVRDCYRYGRRRDSTKDRPVLLEFVHTWNRNLIFFNKSVFKGSKVVIGELLLGQRYDIYREAKKTYNRDCWTVNGKTIVLINGEKRIIHSLDDLKTGEK